MTSDLDGRMWKTSLCCKRLICVPKNKLGLGQANLPAMRGKRCGEAQKILGTVVCFRKKKGHVYKLCSQS